MAMCSILDDPQIVLARHEQQRIHIHRPTKEMYRYDSFCVWRDRLLQPGHIHVTRDRVDINKPRRRTDVLHSKGSSNIGVGCGDHLVTRAHATRRHCQVHSLRPVGNAHSVLGATVRGLLAFEGRHDWARSILTYR